MIDITNLTKVYDKSPYPVIDRLNLKAFKGHITALLGESGSGKTTLTSLLSGSMHPSAGKIIIKGYNMSKTHESRNAARLLGICPEYNVSIDEFSIWENLDFFCKLKGFDSDGIEQEINHILGTLDLDIKRNRIVTSLSASAKRRLSLAIALVAESEVVIMDEPTSHMDSYSRRIVWEALSIEKNVRAIFLTTSRMKEANALADRIAVLSNGHIQCCGSPLFLKKLYGAEYQLKIFKDPGCNTTFIRSLMHSKIPGAVFIKDNLEEIQYILPHESRPSYQKFFKELEEKQKEIHVSKIVVSEITLKELFDRMMNTENEMNQTARNLKSRSSKSTSADLKSKVLTKERNDGFALFSQHIDASLKKHYIYYCRNKLLTASQIFVLPLIILFSHFMTQYIASKSIKQDFKLFSLDAFEATHVIYGIDSSRDFSIDLGDIYAERLSDKEITTHLVDLEEENYLSFILNEAEKDLKLYNTKYIIGAIFQDDFNKTMITVLYNAVAYHSAPTSLLYVYNAMLEYYTQSQAFHFTINNAPLPYKETDSEILATEFNVEKSFSWAEDLMIAMGILMSSFVIILVVEKSSKFKKQQMICGLNAFVYWFSSFLYDFGIYLAVSIVSICLFSILEIDCLSGFKELISLLLVFFLHGISGLLLVYCFTFCSESPAIGYLIVFLIYYISTGFLMIVYSLEANHRYDVSEPLNILFSILSPSYCILRGIYSVHKNCVGNVICNTDIVQQMCSYENSTTKFEASCCIDNCGDTCIYWSTNFFIISEPGIGIQLICLIIQPFIYMLILILLEMQVCKKIKRNRERKRLKLLGKAQYSGGDKLEESNIIQTSPLSQLIYNYYLFLRGVVKLGNSNVVVSKLSFGVKRGECFGIVGIDKAGKTVVLKIISGFVLPTRGDIYIDGFNIIESPHMVQDKIGFSFGGYSLLEDFTINETLTLYAHLRGIPEKEVSNFVEYLTSMLSLEANTMVNECRCIERRKLSVAISIIGTPPLVLLDEPLADMDPISSKQTKELMHEALNMGCTVILATQRIDMAKIFCKRIGILVKGKVTHIGDFNELTKNYKGGYTLTIKMEKFKKEKNRLTRTAVSLKGNIEEIKGYIEDALPEAILKMEYSSYVDFYIPDTQIRWSKTFAVLEKIKGRDLISDYFIYEVNLDKIFSYNIAAADDTKEKEIAEYLKERKYSEF